MAEPDFWAEAYCVVRSRYTEEEFGNLRLDRLIREVREEARALAGAEAAQWQTWAW